MVLLYSGDQIAQCLCSCPWANTQEDSKVAHAQTTKLPNCAEAHTKCIGGCEEQRSESCSSSGNSKSKRKVVVRASKMW
jgi:hypothetical protein